jgi:type IV pilus assembly protein PilA
MKFCWDLSGGLPRLGIEMDKQRGFTLIELMIVVAIIAILAAIAISQYQDYVAKAQVTEAFNIADGLKTKVAEIYNQTAQCPGNASSGIPLAASLAGKYVQDTVTGGTPSADGGCTLEMTFKATGSASGAIAGKKLLLTMQGVENGVARWTCQTGTTIDKKYLPKTCH